MLTIYAMRAHMCAEENNVQNAYMPKFKNNSEYSWKCEKLNIVNNSIQI